MSLVIRIVLSVVVAIVTFYACMGLSNVLFHVGANSHILQALALVLVIFSPIISGLAAVYTFVYSVDFL